MASVTELPAPRSETSFSRFHWMKNPSDTRPPLMTPHKQRNTKFLLLFKHKDALLQNVQQKQQRQTWEKTKSISVAHLPGFPDLIFPWNHTPPTPRGFLHLQTRGLPRYRGHQAKDLQTDAETQQGHSKGPSVGKIQPWYLTYCEVLCY